MTRERVRRGESEKGSRGDEKRGGMGEGEGGEGTGPANFNSNEFM